MRHWEKVQFTKVLTSALVLILLHLYTYIIVAFHDITIDWPLLSNKLFYSLFKPILFGILIKHYFCKITNRLKRTSGFTFVGPDLSFIQNYTVYKKGKLTQTTFLKIMQTFFHGNPSESLNVKGLMNLGIILHKVICISIGSLYLEFDIIIDELAWGNILSYILSWCICTIYFVLKKRVSFLCLPHLNKQC